MPVPLCQHCQERKGNRPRGLCTRCYRTLDIRVQYPTKKEWTRGRADETEAELDAMIEKWLRPENLPPWWADAVARQQEIDQPVEIRIVHDNRRR